MPFFANFQGSSGGMKKKVKNGMKIKKKILVRFLCIFEVLENFFVLQKFRGQNMASRKKTNVEKMAFFENFDGSDGGVKKRQKK